MIIVAKNNLAVQENCAKDSIHAFLFLGGLKRSSSGLLHRRLFEVLLSVASLTLGAASAFAAIDCSKGADGVNRQKINSAFASSTEEGLKISKQFSLDCPQNLMAQLNLGNASRSSAREISHTETQRELYAQAVEAFTNSINLLGAREDKAFAVLHGALANALLGLGDIEKARLSARISWSYFYAADQNRYAQEPAEIKETRMEIERRFKIDAASLSRAVNLGKNAVIVEAASVDVRVGFDFNKANLSPLGLAQVKQLAEALREQGSNTRFTLVGHTDDVGADNVNLALSLERARTVAREIELQLPQLAGLIQTKGEGKNKPLFYDKSDSARALNRRVELQLIEK